MEAGCRDPSVYRPLHFTLHQLTPNFSLSTKRTPEHGTWCQTTPPKPSDPTADLDREHHEDANSTKHRQLPFTELTNWPVWELAREQTHQPRPHHLPVLSKVKRKSKANLNQTAKLLISDRKYKPAIITLKYRTTGTGVIPSQGLTFWKNNLGKLFQKIFYFSVLWYL